MIETYLIMKHISPHKACQNNTEQKNYKLASISHNICSEILIAPVIMFISLKNINSLFIKMGFYLSILYNELIY